MTFDVNGDGNIDAGDTVDTLLDLDDPNTKVYEAHGAITKEWADKLIAVSPSYANVVVAYARDVRGRRSSHHGRRAICLAPGCTTPDIVLRVLQQPSEHKALRRPVGHVALAVGA